MKENFFKFLPLASLALIMAMLCIIIFQLNRIYYYMPIKSGNLLIVDKLNSLERTIKNKQNNCNAGYFNNKFEKIDEALFQINKNMGILNSGESVIADNLSIMSSEIEKINRKIKYL